MSQKSYDFEGWVTKNDLRCADGRTIRKNAFKDQDGGRVPLCWGHQHDDPTNVLGHMDLENREDGVWGYGSFNKTELAQYAKEQVIHGDITCLSIWANLRRRKRMSSTASSVRSAWFLLAPIPALPFSVFSLMATMIMILW